MLIGLCVWLPAALGPKLPFSGLFALLSLLITFLVSLFSFSCFTHVLRMTYQEPQRPLAWPEIWGIGTFLKDLFVLLFPAALLLLPALLIHQALGRPWSLVAAGVSSPCIPLATMAFVLSGELSAISPSRWGRIVLARPGASVLTTVLSAVMLGLGGALASGRVIVPWIPNAVWVSAFFYCGCSAMRMLGHLARYSQEDGCW